MLTAWHRFVEWFRAWWDREQCKRFSYAEDTEYLTSSTKFGPFIVKLTTPDSTERV